MKKVLIAIVLVLGLVSTASAAGVTSGRDYLEATISSGVIAASAAIKTTGGIVYGITGQAAAADFRGLLCDGDALDTETAAKQLIEVGVGVDNDPIVANIPAKGVRFPNGIYWNEKTGDATITIMYK